MPERVRKASHVHFSNCSGDITTAENGRSALSTSIAPNATRLLPKPQSDTT